MWIPSKLTIPAPLHKSIQRTRILKELEACHQNKVVLFQSPAGFGKTTLVAQWLASFTNLGWFSIDKADNDPQTFAYYFTAALNNANKDGCSKVLLLAQNKQSYDLKQLFNHIINDVAAWKEPSYLVLDDYHLIKNEEIHAALKHFLKHIPPCLTLVITSRTSPNLGIANLRVRCQLHEIDSDLLAFDDEETHRFLSQFNEKEVDEKASQKIRAQVEGWPSATQLIALHYKKVNDLTLDIPTNHLWDYLAEEVFDELDEKNRIFLMQCAIFSHFNHELVYLLTGEANALDRLDELYKQGLILRFDQSQNYRFHHLFTQFLTHQRHRLMPEKERELRSKAVNAWIQTNKIEQALSCAMEASNNHLTIEVLLNHGWKLFTHGDLRLLNSALETLHNEELFVHPPLVFLKAWLAQAQHKYNEAGEQLEFGIQEIRLRNINLTSTEQGEYYALMAQVAINQNQAEEALSLSEKAFEYLAANSYHSRIVATSIVGEVHFCHGQLDQAFSLMQQAEKLATQYGLYQQALWTILQQSEIDIAKGLTHSGLDKLNKAQQLITKHHLEELPLFEFMLRIRASLMWHLYRLDEAEKLANQSIGLMSYYEKFKSLPALTQLAKNTLLRGELSKTQHYLEQCEKLLEQNDCHLDWRANISMVQLVLWQLKEKKDKAAKWLETAKLPSSATNHFLQLQCRNFARAHFILNDNEKALSILENTLETSRALNLVSDTQYNLITMAFVLDKTEQKMKAEELLIEAINISTSTGITACFYLESVAILPILHRIVKYKELDGLIKHQAKTLIDSMSQHNSARALHFDESIVKKLLASDRLPDAIKTSPLTHREWQVMGLIYSGFSNDQISHELDVAPTTIKTHIRNLYQKLQIANREQAINLAERLIKTINY